MTFWFPDGSGPLAQLQPTMTAEAIAWAGIAAFRAAPIERLRTHLGRAPSPPTGATHSDNDIAPTATGGFRRPDGALA
jgi:hypothetical protein